jgi:hypothetical protein
MTTKTELPRKKWTCTPEQRAKLEKAADLINRDYEDYVSGKKDRRAYPFNQGKGQTK